MLALPSVALVANGSSICSALAGPAASQVLATPRGRALSLAAIGTAEEPAARAATGRAGIALPWGGQTQAAENRAMATAFLGEPAASLPCGRGGLRRRLAP